MAAFFKRSFLFITAYSLALCTPYLFFLILVSLLNLKYGSEVYIWMLYAAFFSVAMLVSYGAAISFTKWQLSLSMISENPIGEIENWLMSTAKDLAAQAGLKDLPELGIYQSFECNAFVVSDWSGKSLIAVSSGSLIRMDRDAIRILLAQVFASIVKGDAAILTGLQSLLNSGTLFCASPLARAITSSQDRHKAGAAKLFAFFLLQIFFNPLAALLIAYYSRMSKFRSDELVAEWEGLTELKRILLIFEPFAEDVDDTRSELSLLRVYGHSTKTRLGWFASHPSIPSRQSRLKGLDQDPVL